jgi:hypothetical protein
MCVVSDLRIIMCQFNRRTTDKYAYYT